LRLETTVVVVFALLTALFIVAAEFIGKLLTPLVAVTVAVRVTPGGAVIAVVSR
jgi:hypothetical protein